jgi:putative addiction module killer protein
VGAAAAPDFRATKPDRRGVAEGAKRGNIFLMIEYLMRYCQAMKLETTSEYDAWIDGLRDLVGRSRIQARVERLAQGNPGKFRDLGGELSELKIDLGPGYRVYYTQRANVLIVLLCGGDKSTQQKDIRLARKLLNGL